jgi:hypothetical protein
VARPGLYQSRYTNGVQDRLRKGVATPVPRKLTQSNQSITFNTRGQQGLSVHICLHNLYQTLIKPAKTSFTT